MGSFAILFLMSSLAALGHRSLWRLNYFCVSALYNLLLVVMDSSSHFEISRLLFGSAFFSSVLLTLLGVVSVF